VVGALVFEALMTISFGMEAINICKRKRLLLLNIWTI
jgi:hypothetical protein